MQLNGDGLAPEIIVVRLPKTRLKALLGMRYPDES
jgi:hypothetical protein